MQTVPQPSPQLYEALIVPTRTRIIQDAVFRNHPVALEDIRDVELNGHRAVGQYSDLSDYLCNELAVPASQASDIVTEIGPTDGEAPERSDLPRRIALEHTLPTLRDVIGDYDAPGHLLSRGQLSAIVKWMKHAMKHRDKRMLWGFIEALKQEMFGRHPECHVGWLEEMSRQQYLVFSEALSDERRRQTNCNAAG